MEIKCVFRFRSATVSNLVSGGSLQYCNYVIEEGESENNFVIIISNKICTTIRVVKWVHGIKGRSSPSSEEAGSPDYKSKRKLSFYRWTET